MEIIVKSFQPHYNCAFDKVITSQRQYNEEMKRCGYIPYEEAQERDRRNTEERNKFSVSEDAKNWMRSVKDSADKKGNVKLSDRQIERLKDGQTFNKENPALKEAMDNRLPEYYRR